jgi:hypothetical protein
MGSPRKLTEVEPSIAPLSEKALSTKKGVSIIPSEKALSIKSEKISIKRSDIKSVQGSVRSQQSK